MRPTAIVAPPGKRYTAPDSPPALTREQAIQAARASPFGRLVDHAPAIDAYYVLFSDDAYYLPGQARPAFQQTPAWIIVLGGIDMPRRSGPRPRQGQATRPLQYAHELSIVLDARTGAYMQAFSLHQG